MPPFRFNVAALAVLPLSALVATNATMQIDAVYAAADDPATPKAKAEVLAKLASKMLALLNA